MMRKWDPVRAFELIERERINSVGGVPTIAWQLIEHPLRKNYDLSSLESVAYGGAPSAPELVRLIKETFPKSQPGNGWGMTETSATATSNSAEDYEHRPDSCGPAGAGHRPQDHEPSTATASCRSARSASCGARARRWCAATGTSPRRRPRPSSTAG